MLNVYVGYDERERIAYDVCCYSLARRATIPTAITPLRLDVLRDQGMFKREFFLDGQVKIDKRDGKPFSTDFAFTRFLVPYLQNYRGWALFCDCDFLFRADVAELADLMDEQYAVRVVKHQQPDTGPTKMDGQRQELYPRKNWSSFVLWNCGHMANRDLGPIQVNNQSGRWLHGFAWLEDRHIGDLPPVWNWIAGINLPIAEPKAVHYSLGGPWFADWQNVPYGREWRQECKAMEGRDETQTDHRSATSSR